jgi:capsular polysaccharide export protein
LVLLEEDGRVKDMASNSILLEPERLVSGGRDDAVPFPVLQKRGHIQRPLQNVLLLQGPIGPFFAELHGALSASGVAVRRVIFNAGDQRFAPPEGCVRFSGTAARWEAWLRSELSDNAPDAIVLFGSSRPAHKVARHVAAQLGIAVISLEEGYLRSGYVSAELGGNNQHSPLAQWRPGNAQGGNDRMVPAAWGNRSSFTTMSLWGAIYYMVRDFRAKPSDVYLFHRRRERLWGLASSWIVHMSSRAKAKITEIPARRALHKNPGYILVPLQVSSDSQIQVAARGWDTPKLIDASLKALLSTGGAENGGKAEDVVFKLHPLERRSASIKRLIMQKAKQYGVDRRRITVLHSGRIGDLAAQSSGMVVINSTSAFSALHHNIPVLVLGDAVFRHDAIVTVGHSEADIAAFFKSRQVKSRAVIDAFLTELKAQSLIPGDFYVAAGRKAAVIGVIRKLEQITSAPPFCKKMAL